MSKLEIGTVVRLKSGGPKMTCTKVDDPDMEGFVTCEWFKDDNKVESRWFSIESLEVIARTTKQI